MDDLVKFIKSLEKEFLNDNSELHQNNRMEYLRRREEFISQRLVQRKNGEE